METVDIAATVGIVCFVLMIFLAVMTCGEGQSPNNLTQVVLTLLMIGWLVSGFFVMDMDPNPGRGGNEFNDYRKLMPQIQTVAGFPKSGHLTPAGPRVRETGGYFFQLTFRSPPTNHQAECG